MASVFQRGYSLPRQEHRQALVPVTELLMIPATNRLMVFGGELVNVGVTFNDVWVLTNANGLGGTPQWIQLNPTGPAPPARALHVVAYNPDSNRVIVFGGNRDLGTSRIFFNDVWVLTEANAGA